MVNYLQATISWEVKCFNKAKYNYFSLWVKLLALSLSETPLLVWGKIVKGYAYIMQIVKSDVCEITQGLQVFWNTIQDRQCQFATFVCRKAKNSNPILVKNWLGSLLWPQNMVKIYVIFFIQIQALTLPIPTAHKV